MRSIFQKEQFDPVFLGLFINPFYFARKGIRDNVAALSKYVSGATLDVGCGSKPYIGLFTKVAEYMGLEIDNPSGRTGKRADIFYDGKVFPIGNGRFDSVVTLQVLEHVFNPEIFLNEIYRVLKSEGILLISAPFIWDEHEKPFDCARYSSFGLKALLGRHGFEIVENRKTVSGIRAVFQIFNSYIYKVAESENPYLNLLSTLIFIAPFNILGVILSIIAPRDEDLYLDNVIVARKKARIS